MENALGNIVLTLVLLVPLVFILWASRRGADETTDHHPAPAPAPASAGHGHTDHGHGESHGHGHGHHGGGALETALAVLVAVIIIGSIGLFLKALSGPFASVVDHSAPAGKLRLTDGPVRPTVAVEEPCGKPPPEDAVTFVVPVEGSYGPIPVPRGYRACLSSMSNLRTAFNNSDVEPTQWGNRRGENLWVSITPGASAEPITLQYWIVPY